MIIHANTHDGIVHVHDCPDHPPHSTRGGKACFWDDHTPEYKEKYKKETPWEKLKAETLNKGQ